MTASFGIKVSEPGYDVNTADDKNLSMKSGMTLLKVYSQAEITLSSSGFNDITHSLGYLPQFLAFVNNEAGKVYLANGVFHGFTTPNAIAKITTTKLSIYQTINSSQTAFYYIFYEPIDTGTAPAYTITSHYGIIVSKDGVSVENANILQQTFNSEKNSLKIITDSTYTNSGGTSLTVAHGLSFIPGFLVYGKAGDGTWHFLAGDSTYADSTNLHTVFTSDYTKIHYYILADPGVNV